MSADMQAIVDAFYFDTFEAMGVDLSKITVESAELDLSDKSSELKGLVQAQLRGIIKTLEMLRDASGQMTSSAEETSKAIAEIANAVGECGQTALTSRRLLLQARHRTILPCGLAKIYTMSGIGPKKNMRNSQAAPDVPRAFASLATQTRMTMFNTTNPTTTARQSGATRGACGTAAASPPGGLGAFPGARFPECTGGAEILGQILGRIMAVALGADEAVDGSQ